MPLEEVIISPSAFCLQVVLRLPNKSLAFFFCLRRVVVSLSLQFLQKVYQSSDVLGSSQSHVPVTTLNVLCQTKALNLSYVCFLISSVFFSLSCSCLNILLGTVTLSLKMTLRIILYLPRDCVTLFNQKVSLVSCFFIAFCNAESYCLSLDTESEPKTP